MKRHLAVLLLTVCMAAKTSAAIQTLEDVQVGDNGKEAIAAIGALCDCRPGITPQATFFNTQITGPLHQNSTIINLSVPVDTVASITLIYQFQASDALWAAFEAQKKQFEQSGFAPFTAPNLPAFGAQAYHAGPIDELLTIVSDESKKIFMLMRTRQRPALPEAFKLKH